MHTQKYTGLDGTEYLFHHNGDYSGDVRLVTNPRKGMTPVEIDIPFEFLADFVAEAIRTEKIRRLEDATTSQLLGLEDDL